MNLDITNIALNVGSIFFGGVGVHLLVKRDRRVRSMESDRRMELNGLRVRLIELERFKLRATWYLEQLGAIRGLPPWKSDD